MLKPAGLLFLSTPHTGTIAFLDTGLAMAFLFGLIWGFFVYRNDPDLDLHAGVTRLKAWGKA